MKRALRAAVVAAVVLAAALTAPSAGALPGQCMDTRWGGFCDGYGWEDGSFQHCERALGFFSQCYQACHDPITNRPIPTDMDIRTPC